MKIDLSIYNRILFGDLRPWLDTNKSEEKFRQKLNPSFKVPKGGAAAFEKAINTALKDHPILLKEDDYIFEIEEDKIKISSVRDEIFEPLIDIDIPPHFNNKTEFYYYLIKNEGTRLMNNLNKALHLCEKEKDAKYLINSTLIKVKSFLKETSTLKKQIGYTDNLRFDELPKDKTEAQKKINDYILSALKTTLLRLVLEIQELFAPLLASKKLNEDEIYLTIIGEASPSMNHTKTVVKLNDFIVKRFIHEVEYNKQKALDRLNETKENIALYYKHDTPLKDIATRKAALCENIQALENLIYIREFGFAEANPNYEKLISEQYTEEVFTAATTSIFEKLEEIGPSNKRLVLISKEEERLSFLKTKVVLDESVYMLSIPRKVLKWLADQRTYIEANLHIDFSKLTDGKAQKIKTNLSVPQLALLFKMIQELKPDIFDIKSEAELLRFISANFITKKSGEEGISTDKLRILFNQPDIKAADFWEKHLHTMLAQARKIQKP